MDFISNLSKLHNEYKDKFEQLLQDLSENLQKNIFINDYYEIPKHKFVEQQPIINMKNINKINELYNIDKSKKSKIDVKYKDDYEIYKKYIECPNLCSNNHIFLKDNMKFIVPKKLMMNDDEYVVFIKFVRPKCDTSTRSYGWSYSYNIDVLYITNFGRFIHSKPIQITESSQNPNRWYTYDIFSMKNDYILSIKSGNTANGINNYEQLIDFTQETNQLKPLKYKMPNMFLNVYNAFRYEDEELMQECNKIFFDLINENKNLKQKIQELYINDKDKIIDDKDKEIDKLKKEIQELKKFYLNNN